ncbi:Arc family DNA-binding protein [Neorhizobium sp. T25_13]|uniref:Arc family DNA-binding protein n=1 Tax=Neorhizobium sp. T25_13 TaxID=2093830 RepID=UPI000CF98BE8|nr:Arc family DNA-binding protein [Neorhizobium sp. T25_13]
MAPKQTDPQFKLRLPPDLKQALEEAAMVNNRSVSAEIIARLQDSLIAVGKEFWLDRRIAAIDRQLEEQRAQINDLLNRPRD